jgi:hypothetical protein
VAAPPARVWQALVKRMGGSSRPSEVGAALLGCRERRASGSLDRVGATIPGFRVDRADAPHELALVGRHRFSAYGLTFRIDDLGGGRSRLRALTHAAFPGVAGTAYRALVIGTRLHVAATRGMLRGVRRKAEA